MPTAVKTQRMKNPFDSFDRWTLTDFFLSLFFILPRKSELCVVLVVKKICFKRSILKTICSLYTCRCVTFVDPTYWEFVFPNGECVETQLRQANQTSVSLTSFTMFLSSPPSRECDTTKWIIIIVVLCEIFYALCLWNSSSYCFHNN